MTRLLSGGNPELTMKDLSDFIYDKYTFRRYAVRLAVLTHMHCYGYSSIVFEQEDYSHFNEFIDIDESMIFANRNAVAHYDKNFSHLYDHILHNLPKTQVIIMVIDENLNGEEIKKLENLKKIYKVEIHKTSDMLDQYFAFRNYVLHLARICGSTVNIKKHILNKVILEALYMEYERASMIFNTVMDQCFDTNMKLLTNFR